MENLESWQIFVWTIGAGLIGFFLKFIFDSFNNNLKDKSNDIEEIKKTIQGESEKILQKVNDIFVKLGVMEVHQKNQAADIKKNERSITSLQEKSNEHDKRLARLEDLSKE